MLEFLHDAVGEYLDQAVYKRDYRERNAAVRNFDAWKLERQQHFREPYDAGWQAFARGDWAESLRLHDEYHDQFSEWVRKDAAKGITFRRVRVVEKPIVPYLHWELCAFRVQVEVGLDIRVVDPELIRPFEGEEPLPELVNVGSDTLYRIIYDETGTPDGGVRYTGEEIVSRYVAFVESLWDQGEEFTSFFEREVAHLPPPRGA